MHTHHLLRTLLCVGFILGSISACGDSSEDTGGGEVRLSIVALPPDAEVDEAIGLTVSGIRGSRALDSGTALQVVDLNVLNGTGPQVGVFQYASVQSPGALPIEIQTGGSTRVEFLCTDVGVTNVAVSLVDDPTVTAQTQITCKEAPSGDWTVSEVEVTSGTLTPTEDDVTLTATVVDGDGDAVEADVRMEFRILNGESLVIPEDGSVLRADTDEDGQVSFKVETTKEIGPTTIQISFGDERLGAPFEDVINVRDDVVTDTILTLTVRKNGQVLPQPSDWRVLADGEDFVTLEVEVTPPDGSDIDPSDIAISATRLAGPGGFKDSINDTTISENASATTDTNGRTAFVFSGGDLGGGTANLQFTAPNPDPGESGNIVLDASINVVSLGFIEFESVNPSVLYVKGSGENQSADVSFKILDTNRNALEGVRVEFALNNPPAGTILDVSETRSNANGIVTTTISSGRGTGTVSVGISAFFGSAEPITTSSPAIPIIGARPTRESWNVQCEALNIGGFIGRQGNQIVVDDQFECTSILKDRFTNPIGVPQQVLFKSEGGNILSLATSEEWDTDRNPEEPPDNVGRLSVLYSPAGDPPCDVNPFQDEFDDSQGDAEPWLEVEGNCGVPFNGCPSLGINSRCIRNPRDGLATILAFTSGEEEFSDLNGDGVYNPGEPFRDLGEPFIDVNDNNQWDPGERFEDLEQGTQGQYDGPNGVWDSNTTIWTTTRVLLTGHGVSVVNPAQDTLSQYPDISDSYGFIFTGSPANPSQIFPRDSNITFSGGNGRVSIWWLDSNLNPLNNSTSYDAGIVGNSNGVRVDEANFIEGDYYGFDVLQSLEFINEASQISRYITEVGNWPVGLPSGAQPYGADLQKDCDCRAPGEYEPVNIVLEFEATYRISNGVGGTSNIQRTVPVTLCTGGNLADCPPD